MIVDVNTRTWTSPAQFGEEASAQLRHTQSTHWLRADHGIDALLSDMECVDVAIVHGFRSMMLDAHIPNEHVADLVARQPDRLIGIAGIDPLAPGALEEIDRIIDMGLSGITVSPSMQGVHPTHSAAMRVYEACETRGLPVIVSRPDIGLTSSVFEFDRPGSWDEVARSFPKLRIVIGSLGYPWIDETLALLQKHGSLFADLSVVASRPWQAWNALLTANALGVMERLLFASGWPSETPARAIETLYSLNTFSQGSHLPSIPRSSIRSIIERDSLEALGIDRSPAHAGERPRADASYQPVRSPDEANQQLPTE